MDPVTVIATVQALVGATRGLVLLAESMHASGEMTPEQLAEVRRTAALADERWDAEMDRIRTRLGGARKGSGTAGRAKARRKGTPP